MPHLTFSDGKKIYYDGYLLTAIEEIKAIQKHDGDVVGIIDGFVGSGKSTMSQQIAIAIDPNFTARNICMDAENLKEVILNAEKGSAIVFDEALNGLNIRRTMSSINILLTSLLTEIRQRNLVILLCLPSLFDMDKSISIHRSLFLIHVFAKGRERGYFRFYGKKKKSLLFADTIARRTYQYKVRPSFWGRFYGGYVVDELEYRKLKNEVLKRYFVGDKIVGKTRTPDEIALDKEILLFHKLHESGLSISEMSKRTGVHRATITSRLKKYKQTAQQDDIVSNIHIDKPHENSETEED